MKEVVEKRKKKRIDFRVNDNGRISIGVQMDGVYDVDSNTQELYEAFEVMERWGVMSGVMVMTTEPPHAVAFMLDGCYGVLDPNDPKHGL